MCEAALTPRAQASCVGRVGRLVPPSATFVRHSPGRATRSIAPTTCPAATTSRRSRPTGGTSSWIKAPCFVNQESGADLRERSRDVEPCLAAEDIRAPASKPRLDDNGRPDLGRLAWRANVHRLRMREAGVDQESGGSKLVVRVQERVRSVDDANAVALELGQDLDAGLHAVERCANVESSDRDVVTTEQESGIRRRQHPCRDTDVPPSVDDEVVGFLWPADDAHEFLASCSAKRRSRHGAPFVR